ncbi:MAG: hypothetical protein Q4B43_10970, partial [Bacteroidota bacterium]|nr:hypothetical protein [Bacteroidota bacterium]
NRYTYCLNNPFKYTDPSGEIAWFVPVIVGAVIGAYSGGVIANEGQYNPVKWDYNSGRTWGYMLGGGLIGGLSGSAAAGIGLIGGSPWLAGAVSGAISGAGFSGLSTNWNPEAMLKGAAIAGLSGLVGGGLGAAIGGGWGAFTGGAASAGLSTALNGGTLKQTLTSMLLGGTLSYTAYDLTSYIAYKHANLPHVNYKQFKTMQADFQRSRFWHKEYGGILTKDGNVVRAPAAYRNKYSVNFDAAWTGKISPDNIQTHYHTHWDANNKLLGIDNFGNEIRTANGPSYTDKLFITNTRAIVNTGILIDRQSFYFYNMYGIGANWGSTLLRYFPFYWLYYK